MSKKEHIDFSECTFIGLDEWVGIPPANEGSCHFFLKTHLFDPLGIADRQINLFDASSTDLQRECLKMDTRIREKGGIDLILVGVGMNGHIGFNEPGVSFDHYSHVATLDSTTRNVGQKYFKETTALTYGITLGLRHLLEAGRAIMMASGQHKAGVVRAALEDAVSEQLPAGIIRKHPNGIVMLDEEAASLLTV